MLDTLLSSSVTAAAHSQTRCASKYRLLVALLAAHVGSSEGYKDTALSILQPLVTEFPHEPIVHVAIADAIISRVTVGNSIVLSSGRVGSTGIVMTTARKLQPSDITTAVYHMRHAIQMLNVTGSNDSLISAMQYHHPLSAKGLVWNLCGCGVCEGDCSVLQPTDAAFTVQYRHSLRFAVAFRLSWLLFDKGRPVDAAFLFESCQRELAAQQHHSSKQQLAVGVLTKLLELGLSLLSESASKPLEAAMQAITSSTPTLCHSHPTLHSMMWLDLCSPSLYQQLAVILHKRVRTAHVDADHDWFAVVTSGNLLSQGLDEHSKSLLRVASSLGN